MNKFEKVSYAQFEEDFLGQFPDFEENTKTIQEIYNRIKLPKRATKGSAGYDFYTPFSFCLKPNQSIVIPTGIKVTLDEDKVLCLVPRSGHGFKYRTQLDNTVGIIDSDYYFSENEGHIMAKITCDSKNQKTIWHIDAGQGFLQGIILQYFTAEDDNTTENRNGGFGSTDKK